MSDKLVQSLAKHCNFNTTVGQTHVFQEAPPFPVSSGINLAHRNEVVIR